MEQEIFDAVMIGKCEIDLSSQGDSNGFIRKLVAYLDDVQSIELIIGVERYWTQDIILLALYSIKPVIDALTIPRSVDEFLNMKRGLYKVIESGHYGNYWRNRLLVEILDPLGIVGLLEKFDLSTGTHTADSLFTLNHYTPRESVYFEPNRKLVTPERARLIIDQMEEENDYPIWIGYVGGKWRQGITEGHIDLFTNARRVLGNGLLVAAVESKRSILARLQRGEDYFVLDDEERVKLLASQQDVDLVILVDPPEERLGDITYFDQIEAALQPHYRFIGYRNHEYFDRISQVCRRLGTILLWDSVEQRRRTSKRIADLQNKY
jgi:glycerol-3-phosphate cytidylyltransferase-like family protein